MDYTITLSETEDKALSYAAYSQQDWIDNAVHERARIAIDEIADIVVKHCLDNGIQVPATREDIVAYGFDNGIVKTAAVRQAEAQAEAEMLGN
mgnify:CR=1 FL=1|tara:strand:- start:580 stop:858 length:279 start_codon:yes stop_codon:yes gene_type:complete